MTLAIDPPLRSSGPRTAMLMATYLPGLIPFLPMWERQRELAIRRQRDEIGDQLLLLEHPHVYTNGRHGDPAHLLADPATLASLGASYHQIDRGGDITYHGPGQLIGYPIVRLGGQGWGVRDYVRGLERAIIRTAAHFGVAATTLPGYPGVWVGNDKLAAIGVKVSRGIAYHGFALNVVPDLRYFTHIIPCGLAGRGVTSIAQVCGSAPPLPDVAVVLAHELAAVFGEELHWSDYHAERCATTFDRRDSGHRLSNEEQEIV